VRFLEHPDVLRHSGQRHAERLGELADGRATGAEAFEHGPACRVGESCERTVDEPFCQVVSPLASLFELGQSLFEEAALGVGVDEFEGAFVGCSGVVGAFEPAQELAAGRVQIVVVLEFEPLGERECGLNLSRFGERGGLVELDDGRAGAACELAVEGRELRPVLGLVEVEGGDGGLE
jgi:hypothetical protein